MTKIIYLIALALISSCGPRQAENTEANSVDKPLTQIQEIEKFFTEVDSVLNINNGKFWNHPLNGPVIIVDPETRLFYANQNNLESSFRKVNSIYSDTLPNEINMANTAFNWNEKRWSMVMLPLPTNKHDGMNLMIHELFHLAQPGIGFDKLQEIDNAHLDTYQGRLLLRLELEALKKAINSENEEKKIEHVHNALFFRTRRHSIFESRIAENSLEINEGLAEYTGIMLSGRSISEMNLHLTNSINQFYSNPTFVRSFAYETIPVYGYLLSLQDANWHSEISKDTQLTEYFIKAFSAQLVKNTSFDNLAKENQYDFENIVETEKLRETERLAKIEGYKQTFLEQPTLKLNFENMNISFDPRNIIPLDEIGTVYPNLRVNDNWGILTVENGALLSSDWSNVIVTEPTEITESLVKGLGWTLELNPGWHITKTGDNFDIKKE